MKITLSESDQTNQQGKLLAIRCIHQFMQKQSILFDWDPLDSPRIPFWAGFWRELCKESLFESWMSFILFEEHLCHEELKGSFMCLEHEQWLKNDENYRKKIDHVLQFEFIDFTNL